MLYVPRTVEVEHELRGRAGPENRALAARAETEVLHFVGQLDEIVEPVRAPEVYFVVRVVAVAAEGYGNALIGAYCCGSRSKCVDGDF